jgi:Zn-dependent protease with chaperone function
MKVAAAVLAAVVVCGAQDSEKDSAYGQALDLQVSQHFSIGVAPDVARRVFARLTQTEIAKKSSVKTFQLSLVKTSVVNAFSTAGGHLYVTDGRVAALGDNEGEFAFVMGHEMGHLIRRHRLKRQIRTIAENVAYHQIRSSIGRIGFLAGRKIAEGKIRRDEESEADKLGLFLASQAGYHPDSAIAATEHLRTTYPESSKIQAFLNDDHPRWATRGERVKQNYAEALALYSGRLSKDIDVDSLTSPVVETSAKTVATIESEPADSTLFVDAKPQGRTPATVELDPGPHYLLIRRDGLEMWTQDIDLKPGASIAISAQLKAVEKQPEVIVVQPAQLKAVEQQQNVIVVPSQAK